MASRTTSSKRLGSGRVRLTTRVAPRRMPRGSRGKVRPLRQTSYRRSSYRRPTHRSRLWGLLAAGLAATAVLALIGFMVARAHAPDCALAGNKIIFADQVTQEEGSNPHPPPGLVGEAERLASCGRGQLVLIRGAGQGGVQAGPVISLRIYRDAGEIENDPTARANKARQLVAHSFDTASAIRPPGPGRDVIGLIATISAELGRGQNDVWLRTFGLPTVNPANSRVLMAADPAQAAASIAGPLPQLHGAQVHLVLSPAAGDQPRLNPATDAWRRQFMVALLRRMGADVVSVTEEETIEPPARGARPAPIVANLPDSTQQPPAKPRPHRLYTAKLDSSTWFQPNSARFTVSKNRVVAELQPIVRGWRHGLYSRVTVTGHCARYGPAATAVLLSRQRAATVARLLRLQGVGNVTSTGVGYSQPLPPDPTSASNRVVIITAYPKD